MTTKTAIVNGFVVDPGSRVNSKLNIVIENGKIYELTDKLVQADITIDASGKIVTPGFIDIHMHEDSYDEELGSLCQVTAYAMLRMGVTTSAGGNCGSNVCEPKRYMEIVGKEKNSVNLALFAGHGDLREKAGLTDKYACSSENDIKKMVYYAEEALEAGCIGISYGTKYVPGTTFEEMNALARLCKNGRIISSHVRYDASRVFEAADELFRLGFENNVSVQFSHIGSMGGYSQMERLLQMIDIAKLNGLDVSCDCYPYYAFSTQIGATTYDEGFLESYKTDYSSIEICTGKFAGQRCNSEIFSYLRRHEPEAVTVCHVMTESDVDMAVIHPNVMIASDAFIKDRQGHPRAAGTFPRFLKNYARTGRISLYNAVSKITCNVADKLGLSNKGRLCKGADADIVIFDYDKISDNSDFNNPLLPPSGIDKVLIGGQIACDNGVIVNGRLGTMIKKN